MIRIYATGIGSALHHEYGQSNFAFINEFEDSPREDIMYVGMGSTTYLREVNLRNQPKRVTLVIPSLTDEFAGSLETYIKYATENNIELKIVSFTDNIYTWADIHGFDKSEEFISKITVLNNGDEYPNKLDGLMFNIKNLDGHVVAFDYDSQLLIQTYTSYPKSFDYQFIALRIENEGVLASVPEQYRQICMLVGYEGNDNYKKFPGYNSYLIDNMK